MQRLRSSPDNVDNEPKRPRFTRGAGVGSERRGNPLDRVMRPVVHQPDSLIPAPGVAAVFNAVGDVNPEMPPNYRYNEEILSLHGEEYREYIENLFGSVRRDQREAEQSRMQVVDEMTDYARWNQLKPIRRNVVLLQKHVDEEFTIPAGADPDDIRPIVELKWLVETAQSPAVTCRYAWQIDGGVADSKLFTGDFYTPDSRHAAEAIVQGCQVRMEGYVLEDKIPITQSFGFAWKEAFNTYYATHDIGPRDFDTPTQHEVTIQYSTHPFSQRKELSIIISAVDIVAQSRIRVRLDRDVNCPPPGFEPSPIWKWNIAEAAGVGEAFRAAYDAEMGEREKGGVRTLREKREGEAAVRDFLRYTRAILWLKFAYEQLIWYRTDSVEYRLAYLRLDSEYRPWCHSEIRRRSDEPITLFTFEDGTDNDRVMAFNENFHRPKKNTAIGRRTAGLITKIRAPAILTTYGEQAMVSLSTRYWFECHDGYLTLSKTIDALRWVEDGVNRGFPQHEIDILARAAVTNNEMICDEHPHKNGLHQTSCCPILKSCNELDPASDICLVCQSGHKAHKQLLKELPKQGGGRTAYEKARSVLYSDSKYFALTYSTTVSSVDSLYKYMVISLRTRTVGDKVIESYHCQLLDVDLDVKDMDHGFRPEIDAFDLLFVLDPGGNAWLAHHYPGNTQWLPACLNRAKWVYSQASLVRFCEALYVQVKWSRHLKVLKSTDPAIRRTDFEEELYQWIQRQGEAILRLSHLERRIEFEKELRRSMEPSVVEGVYRPATLALPADCEPSGHREAIKQYKGSDDIPPLPEPDLSTPNSAIATSQRNQTVIPILDSPITDFYQEKYKRLLPIGFDGTQHVFTAEHPSKHSASTENLQYIGHHLTLVFACNRRHETMASVTPRTLRLFTLSECLRLDGRDKDSCLLFTSTNRTSTEMSIGRAFVGCNMTTQFTRANPTSVELHSDRNQKNIVLQSWSMNMFWGGSDPAERQRNIRRITDAIESKRRDWIPTFVHPAPVGRGSRA
ncbi:hypothetical protein QFC24_006253 [Naganishia onofrii]|uniref:Uncharacterized protein n=1 Tax=Naganishia onofrii TaxID=1851511 RepID=A0ACC2X3S2_9TREE|nr:hypothetical protein QFC24_006253 [Naganishia onofrii]